MKRAGAHGETAINLALAIASTLFTYLLLEIFFLRYFATWKPLKTHKGLHEGIRILAQSSKREPIPHDYLALVGDSYAAGKGDWFKTQNRFRNPPFHSAHVIFERTGIDVITWGANGAGSLRALVAEPISQFEYLNASTFELDPPRTILVYFFEGNDLNDNLQDLRLRFDTHFDRSQVYDPAVFRKFLDEVVVGRDPLHRAARSFTFTDNLFIGDLVVRALGVAYQKLIVRKLPPVWHNAWEDPPDPNGTMNRARVGGRVVEIPDGLLSPSLELTPDEERLGVWVFAQALDYLTGFFPNSRIGVVYIPSPLACYSLTSPTVKIHTYDRQRKNVYDRARVGEASDRICASIEAVARAGGFGFVDARPFVRAPAARQLIHGPRDWGHFNEVGYRALADSAIRLLESDLANLRCASGDDEETSFRRSSQSGSGREGSKPLEPTRTHSNRLERPDSGRYTRRPPLRGERLLPVLARAEEERRE